MKATSWFKKKNGSLEFLADQNIKCTNQISIESLHKG